jgi:hypothetical protein
VRARRTLALASAGLVLAATAPPSGAAGPVARVYDSPITKAAFDHWMVVAARSAGRKTVPAEQTRAWKGLRTQVMSLLLGSHWLTGEATLRQIYVSPPTVRRLFVTTRNQSFASPAGFRRFLRASGMTRRDVLFRVRLDEISSRIRMQVTRGHHGASAQMRALDKFVVDFRTRWQIKTSCAPAYRTPDCSGVLAAP